MKEKKENDVLLAKWLSGEVTDQEVESILGPKELESYKSLVDIIDQFEVEEYNTDQEMLKLKHRLDSEKKAPRVVSIKKYFPYISAAASVICLTSVFLPMMQQGLHDLLQLGVERRLAARHLERVRRGAEVVGHALALPAHAAVAAADLER